MATQMPARMLLLLMSAPSAVPGAAGPGPCPVHRGTTPDGPAPAAVAPGSRFRTRGGRARRSRLRRP